MSLAMLMVTRWYCGCRMVRVKAWLSFESKRSGKAVVVAGLQREVSVATLRGLCKN